MSFDEFNEFEAFFGAQKDDVVLPKIMIVDDDLFIRHSLTALLENFYHVKSFGEGASAVEEIDETFDAALVDIMMHPHNGFWVFDQMHQKLPDLPIIFNSAFQETAVDADLQGRYLPFAFLTKGSDVSGLLNTIAHAVKCHRELREQRS